EVMLSSRDSSKLSEWKAENGDHAKIGNFEEVAEFGEIIVLAVKGTVAANVIEDAGPQNLKGKTIIDATNPLAETAPENGVLHFVTQNGESLMEILQERFPAAHFVKAFNSVGSAHMVNPSFSGGTPTMFICGNNDNAKKDVTGI